MEREIASAATEARTSAIKRRAFSANRETRHPRWSKSG